MDLEKEATVNVDTSHTVDIADKCNELLATRKQIEKCEANLADLKKDEKILATNEIPKAMAEAGVTMLKLYDGSTVEVKPIYSARMPSDSRKQEAFEWLRENGAGDLIKNIVSLNFGRAEDITPVFVDCNENMTGETIKVNVTKTNKVNLFGSMVL